MLQSFKVQKPQKAAHPDLGLFEGRCFASLGVYVKFSENRTGPQFSEHALRMRSSFWLPLDLATKQHVHD